MKKEVYGLRRTERVVESLRLALNISIPSYFDNEEYEEPYVLKVVKSDCHVVIDIHMKSSEATGHIVGRKGSSIKRLRKTVESIACQEDLRVTITAIEPRQTPKS